MLNRALSGLSNLEADAVRKQLTTFYTGGHAGMICSGDTIEWINGRAVVIRSVDQDHDDGRNAYVKNVRERRGRRLVLVSRETYFFERDEMLVERFEGDRVRSSDLTRLDDSARPTGCTPPAWRERFK